MSTRGSLGLAIRVGTAAAAEEEEEEDDEVGRGAEEASARDDCAISRDEEALLLQMMSGGMRMAPDGRYAGHIDWKMTRDCPFAHLSAGSCGALRMQRVDGKISVLVRSESDTDAGDAVGRLRNSLWDLPLDLYLHDLAHGCRWAPAVANQNFSKAPRKRTPM